MKSFKNILFIAFFCLTFSVHQARADTVTEAFCPKMADESAYEKNGLESYKTLVPGADGWIFRTHTDFKTDFSIKPDTLAAMKAMTDSLKARGSELVIVYPPTRGMVHSEYILSKDAKKFDFTDIDAAWKNYSSLIADLNAQGVHIIGAKKTVPGEDFFYKRDHHWDPAGAKLMARYTADFIKSLPAFTTIPRKRFATAGPQTTEYKGTFQKAFKTLCGSELPPQQADAFSTSPADVEDTASALFDEARPDIVLVGTSNSAAKSNVANFEGFLKEALSADVLNLAVSGAGADTSILDYFSSPDFKSHPAKIIIWEIPGYYDLDHLKKKVFDQKIPGPKT